MPDRTEFDITVLDPDFTRIREALERDPYVLLDPGDGRTPLAITTLTRRNHLDNMVNLLAYLLEDGARNHLDMGLVRLTWPWCRSLSDSDNETWIEQLMPCLFEWQANPDAVARLMGEWQKAAARAADKGDDERDDD